LDYDDFVWILKDCAHPSDKLRDISSTLDPKGFWRVDKEKPPELRHTVLSLAAFRDLKHTITENRGDRDKGIQALCEHNDGDGWMLPERISFVQRDNGIIEFDTPDSQSYEVRSKMGERFLPWQLKGTPEESWKECEMHARNILGDEGFERSMKEIENGVDQTKKAVSPQDSKDGVKNLKSLFEFNGD
jgi:hypothetical protein